MRYKTLFRVICKAIGVYFVINGTSTLVGVLASAVGSFLQYPTLRNELPRPWLSLLYTAGPLVEVLAGLYLFFRGRRLADWAIPGNRPYCPECGYDRTGAQSDTCPECGTKSGVQ